MDHHRIARRFYSSNYSWSGPPSSVSATSRAIWLIIGINTAVFGTWVYADQTQDRSLRQRLWTNTMLSWSNLDAGRPWTVLASAFTHRETMHFFFNMLSLNAFSSAFIYAAGVGVGSLHISMLAIGAAIASSAAWLYQQKQHAPSRKDSRWVRQVSSVQRVSAANGASGMVMGFGAAAGLLSPFTRMMILPIPIPIPMWLITSAYIAVDSFYISANDRVGHAAHLGGAFFGALYYMVALRRFGGVSQLLRRRRW